LKEPGGFDKFRRDNCGQKSDGKCIDVIYGIKGDTAEIQALRYPKDIWTEDIPVIRRESRQQLH